jgi:NAD(P)-dependent dehydrogenase (short-subunit alcohol dehydrogenase family)
MNALVVGGSNGIGLSIVIKLLNDNNINNVIVIDKNLFPEEYKCDKIEFIQYDLLGFKDSTELNLFQDIDALYITAGLSPLFCMVNVQDTGPFSRRMSPKSWMCLSMVSPLPICSWADIAREEIRTNIAITILFIFYSFTRVQLFTKIVQNI